MKRIVNVDVIKFGVYVSVVFNVKYSLSVVICCLNF